MAAQFVVMVIAALTLALPVNANAGPLSSFLECLKGLTSRGAVTKAEVTFTSKDQVDASARRLMIAGADNVTNYHANHVDFIAAKIPGFSAEVNDAYSILFMITANDVIKASVKTALKRRFSGFVLKETTYIDRGGNPKEVLVLSPVPHRIVRGFELPSAEFFIVIARDVLMEEVQRLQSKNQAGIMYMLNQVSRGGNEWSDSATTGFQVPLAGGRGATDW